MEKENVVVEEQTRTEREGVLDGKSVGKENKGSAVRGKFKDENALLNAYGALEAEFTRRSQRLKELERRMSEMTAEKPEKSVETEETMVNAADDKPSKAEDVEPVNDGLVGDVSSGEMTRGDDSTKSSSDGAKAVERFVEPGAVELRGENEISEDEIYKRASANEDIRLKIIGDYFSSLKRSGAPLARGGQGTIATPIAKAGSVAQAGDMALMYFRGEKK